MSRVEHLMLFALDGAVAPQQCTHPIRQTGRQAVRPPFVHSHSPFSLSLSIVVFQFQIARSLGALWLNVYPVITLALPSTFHCLIASPFPRAWALLNPTPISSTATIYYIHLAAGGLISASLHTHTLATLMPHLAAVCWFWQLYWRLTRCASRPNGHNSPQSWLLHKWANNNRCLHRYFIMFVNMLCVLQ